MPLQNRVTPFGEIVVDPARGLFTGNRGCLCDLAGQLARRRWRLKAWITCRLSYKGAWRKVMQPRVWTELFFLDEATALAAGHRPCAYCRRDDYNRYREAWARAEGLAAPPRAPEMDARLQGERLAPDGGKVTYRAALADLPDGAMVCLPGSPGRAALIQDGRLLAWSPAGYGEPRETTADTVEVLTPKSSVAVLAAGYRPLLHPIAVEERP